MAKSEIVLEHERTITSARVGEVLKGTEGLYYALLFVRPEYARATNKWGSWLTMGLDVDVREHPRAASREDRLRIDLAADARRTELTVAAGNDAVLRQLEQLLQEIDKVRQNTRGKPETARWEAVMASPVQKQLLQPVVESLKKEGLRPGEVDRFLDFTRQNIGFLTEDNLVGMRAGSPAPSR